MVPYIDLVGKCSFVKKKNSDKSWQQQCCTGRPVPPLGPYDVFLGIESLPFLYNNKCSNTSMEA